jgi:hypothetical protein
MAQPHCKRPWFRLPLLWLLLPLIGLSIWFATGWMTDWVLSRFLSPASQLQTNLYPTSRFTRSLTVTSIFARIDRTEGISEVTVTTENLPLRRLEFKLPLVEPDALKAALAGELATSPDSIQRSIQYQIR